MCRAMFVAFRGRTLFYSLVVLLGMSLLGGLLGYEYFGEAELELGIRAQEMPKIQPTGTITLVVQADKRLLNVYSDGELYKQYRIAVGTSRTPTPIGEWKIVWKDYNWGTGFGTRWMGINVPWGIYGIHGTNKPWTIGQFASHGCIRMRNKDVEELFEWIPIGTPVRIEGIKPKISRTLQKESCGPDVAWLQMTLKEKGYFNERADGIYGNYTEAAVKQYQEAEGIEITGRADAALLKKLNL